MLGIGWLTVGFLVGLIAVMYILDYFKILEKFLPMASGILPRSPLILAVSIIAIVLTTGIISFETVTEGIEGIGVPTPGAQVGDTFQYQIPIVGMEEDGTPFSDTTYAMHLISGDGMIDGRTVNDIYENPAAPFKPGENDLALLYAFAQEEYDDGLTALPGAYAETSTAAEFSSTHSSGEFAWNAVTAGIGDVFYLYGRYDTSWSAGEYEPVVKKIIITGTNPDQGEFALSDNRVRVYYMGATAVYNFAETSVAGYTENLTAAANDKTIDVDWYSNANANRTRDNHMYAELTPNAKSRIDSITISNDDGEFETYSQFSDTTNLNTDDWRFESAPALTNSSSTMYYVGQMPDTLRTATTDKDKVNVAIQYDNSGDQSSNKIYFRMVSLARFGGDYHIDGDVFWLDSIYNSGTTGWT